MFKVQKDAKGDYQISIGTGRLAKADSLQEVVYALEHYFQEGISGYSGRKFDYEGHIKHAEECGCCPLCR